MNLKLAIVFHRKPNTNDLENIVHEILYPYLSTTPRKEITMEEWTINEMKNKYKIYKEENYQGVSYKKRKEDLINKGLDTFDGFCKNHYNIVRFNDKKEAIIGFNSNGFIDEYKINELRRFNEYECDYLPLILNIIIDKSLNVTQREFQVYKRTPSINIKEVVDLLKKTDYVVLVDYIF